MNVKGLVYRVPCGAFGSQPFDLEWFINGKVFLFECKAKGFQLGVKAGIEHCNRRYECYFKNQNIVKNISGANIPYYFAYKNNVPRGGQSKMIWPPRGSGSAFWVPMGTFKEGTRP